MSAPETLPVAHPIAPTTLDDALNAWNVKCPSKAIELNTFDRVEDMKARMIGKSIFASYNDQTGWSIKQVGWGNKYLAFVARILRWCGIAYRDTVLTQSQKLEFLSKLVNQNAAPVLGFLRKEQVDIDVQNDQLVTGTQLLRAYTAAGETAKLENAKANITGYINERDAHIKAARELVQLNPAVAPILQWMKANY